MLKCVASVAHTNSHDSMMRLKNQWQITRFEE